MFERLTLHGTAASLLWGYQPAVTLRSWRIYKHEGQWTLSGTLATVDAFQARQRPLLFTAPRPGGFWAWSVVDGSLQLGAQQLVAKLGPPEQ